MLFATEEVFMNLCRLGASAKDGTKKVGRFGLGFNAVYHVKDVPSSSSPEGQPSMQGDLASPVPSDAYVQMIFMIVLVGQRSKIIRWRSDYF